MKNEKLLNNIFLLMMWGTVLSESKEKEELVITPAGPRPKSSVRIVKPGEIIRGNEEGKVRVINEKVSSVAAKRREELVLTPGGFRDKSQVHIVENGHVLDEKTGTFKKISFEGEVVAEFGDVIRQKIAKPLMPEKLLIPTKIMPAMGEGWIVYAGWTEITTGHLTLFKTTWKVPPAPSTQSGQTIFLFNGIQNSTRIYQPVLQWGPSAAGGGNYWTVASWYVDYSTQPVFHSPLVTVNEGDTLTGVMVLTDISGNYCSYNSYFQGIANTSLPVQNIEELTWANETLEAYNIQKCSDYPATLKTSMKDIELVVDGLHPILNWNPVNRVTDCGQKCVVVSNANPGGQVDLYYRNKTPFDDIAKIFKESDFVKKVYWDNWFKLLEIDQINQWMPEKNIDEKVKAEFAHFIRESLRPDLKTSGLKQEADQDKTAK
jgi:hypothetical protein